MAPWTKASISSSLGVLARMVRISSRESSRARMTRLAPSSYQARATAWLVTPAWVEMWSWRWGACFWARRKTPRSATMAASTPTLSRYSSHSGSRSTSPHRGMVLQVTWTRTPRLWHSSTAVRSSLWSKLPAKARMPKSLPARYTASAP